MLSLISSRFFVRTPFRTGWHGCVLITVLAACGRDPGSVGTDAFPDAIRMLEQFRGPVSVSDLDRDGFDEIVVRTERPFEPTRDMSVVVLHRQDGTVIDQVNYDGQAGTPRFRDVDGDGTMEILVPVVRHDSLFVVAADLNGRKRFGFFVAAGAPRTEPEGELAWDPRVVDFHVVDGGAGRPPKLVTILMTGFAREPRGVFVHALPEGTPLGMAPIGGFVHQSAARSSEPGGPETLLLSTLATNNGAAAGGFDDHHTYLIEMALTNGPHVVRSREMDTDRQTTLSYRDHDGNGTREILVFVGAPSGDNRDDVRIEMLDADTWRVIRSRAVGEAIYSPIVVDLDHDARTELLVARDDEIWGFDIDLALRFRRSIKTRIGTMATFPDVNGDGVDEIVVYPRGGGFLLLDPDLTVRARQASGTLTGVMRRGNGLAPALVIEDGDSHYTAELVANPWYLWFRYREWVQWTLYAFGFLTLALLYRAHLRQRRLLQALQRLRRSDGRGGALLDGAGNVRWTDAGWPGALNDRLVGRTRRGLEMLSSPGVATFCRRIMANPGTGPHVCPEHVVVGERRYELSIEPVPSGGGPWWVLWMRDLSVPTRSTEAHEWTMMAQRVAHSVRNPLTSILLTLQRLRIEYREKAPAVASRLDHYSSRIEDRIEQLRRLTSNFLKFVNLERPDFSESRLNDVVRRFAEEAGRSAPPDIRVTLRLDPHLPPVQVDPDQITSALDNLVANAINAMPRGGSITIATSGPERLASSPNAHEYARLEVLDTGIGIPEGEIDTLFEVGVTTNGSGSGLGLAIVHKIAIDHGGQVAVESEVGTGSGFSLLLPVAWDGDGKVPTATLRTPQEGERASTLGE